MASNWSAMEEMSWLRHNSIQTTLNPALPPFFLLPTPSQLVLEKAGRFPRLAQELRDELPGVGRYTAGGWVVRRERLLTAV